jgi:hypothetical protein
MDFPAEQKLDGLLPHYCQECQNIEINGTGPDFEQSFVYTLPYVQARAGTCNLFKWLLRLPRGPVEPPASVKLCISADSEDLGTLAVYWSNAQGPLASETNDDPPSLHIFAEKGTFR